MLRNNHSGYDAFIQVIKNFRSMSGASIAAGGTVPFIAHFAEITPPSLPGAVLITGIVQLITLILVFQFFRRSSKKTINRVLAISALSLFFLPVPYIWLRS
jgi:hypothetical protein